MNDYQQSILKLIYSGFTTNQIHKMIRYDPELNFLSYRTAFIDFVYKSGLKERTILTMYHKYNDSNIDKIRSSLEKRNIQMVFSDEDCYPTLLKEIYDYPLVLFGMGKMSLLQNKQKLAIVGSRKATQYSEQICDAIVPELVKSHITIVSGMAMGADYFAHLKTIEYSGQTIGVAAFGLDYHYPKATQYISELMRKDHLVISEYYPTTKVQKWRFPERNRIISGLSQGVLVTEANERSGSLITIDLALEQNRNVYCCLGTIFQSLSKGGNNRIKEGAKLVQNAQDIVEDYCIFTEQK
ncbi:DNA-processing protein DprA [Mammaliicoccus sciuri]|uniref:DNA-processing protein DprA n=1 Tax=Mammaliicoccus sciuri TaxID=1296 RepID=UPI002885E680|nr:DNA-processing protein DprA [Mammaliicoccus sciuri]MDT0702096.1 DNA-processing protein DprA [Mammaliicoccus sciuri]